MFNIFMLGLFIAVFGIIALAFIADKFKKIKNNKTFEIVATIIFVVSIFISFKIFTNVIWYHYESKDIAEKGIVFKDRLLLSEHRLIGSSDYGIFEIDKYSRSDRQLEVINVIVNKNKYLEK